MTFQHTFSNSPNETTFFALAYPFSYTDLQNLLATYENNYESHTQIYFRREFLINSVEGRRVDLLTITGNNDKINSLEEGIEGLFNPSVPRPNRFNKPTIFVTARVHPGETQGSHMLNGLLSFLLNEYF